MEIALAAIDSVDKVQYVAHLSALDDVGRRAELALFCRRPEEALALLIANGKIYRAIKLCLTMHRWEQALDLAVAHKTHVDTVLAHRSRHLQQMDHEETS